MDLIKQTIEDLASIREKKPLIHNITNFVVMNHSANVLLALGASPVMAHSLNEVEDMVSFASALVLNIGTLEPIWIESMVKAGKKAKCPIILDPVGSGATNYRTESTKKILNEVKVSVLRGNASEIMSLMTFEKTTKGVDSIHSVDDTLEIVEKISKKYNGLVIAVSGIEDLITDGVKSIRCANGHPMMTLVTGLGCGLTATVGAFCAVQKDFVLASAEAHGFYGVCGELAAEKAKYPGTFGTEFLNALYYCGEKELKSKLKLKEL
ncbi:MAG: hydroxyethylthiazole kinase [Candidatus Lokiarchaeota archaeon]|nr:hydroxyethylthiazole kinase [Candidatus Lokiarchaeota archaeon]